MRKPLVAAVLLSLAPLSVVATSGSEADPAAVAASAPARVAAKPGKYQATIRYTKHGIPHITASNFGSLGFGSGYAAAEASICTLADTLLTGRGQRSRYYGAAGRYNDQVTLDASNLEVDSFVTDLRNRRVVEKLLKSKAGPGTESRQIVQGYVAGVNQWLKTNKITDPACKKARWIKPNATALDIWYGVYLANLLASGGVFVKEMVNASPPTIGDPGLPQLPLRPSQVDKEKLLRSLGKDKSSGFGSNATALGGQSTNTGMGMLLGNPHFPWRGRYHFTQQHLTIPGRYNVAGASLIGSPVVNIGFNNKVAWSHTVSTAYRFTPYEYKTPLPGTRYLTSKGIKNLEHRIVHVKVKKPDGSIGTVREDLYRTAQGYVIDSPEQLMPWGVASFWAIRDANGEQLRTIDSFLNMGKATSVRDLIKRQDAGGGIPWVNTTAADRAGNVVYADHSVVPNVSNNLANICMTPVGRVLQAVAGLPGLDGTLADTTCKWGTDKDAQRPGIFGNSNLPELYSRRWVMNANDSYWSPNDTDRLEGFANIIGCERCARTMRTRMVSQYVIDRLKQGKESIRRLKGHEYANRVRAAEVMRVGGDLDKLCAATGETAACAVLKTWDGRSNPNSVGTHIFDEFISRAPTAVLWQVPFSAADPLNTPRDLAETNPQVVGAMKEAIASLRERNIAFNARWGSLQVAGDRGAPPIPLSGGEGDLSGNANALASRDPVANAGKYRPITYGSSHIQAIAFLPGGRVSASTILTYGQSEDPTSPYSTDQTRLFSKRKWVKFAWTQKQIQRDLVRTGAGLRLRPDAARTGRGISGRCWRRARN